MSMLLSLISLVGTAGARKYLKLPIQHLKTGCTDVYMKRNAVCVPVDNAFSTYVISLNVGSPPQAVRALIDTGSSDFVVLATDYVGSHSDIDREWLFNPLWSSTFSDNGTRFESRFADGSLFEGLFGQDVIHTNDLVIDNFNFAVAFTGTGELGIAGIGMTINESPVANQQLDEPYSNLPWQLKEHGYVLYTAYSLWLNAWSQEFGALTFGAIDMTCLSSVIYMFPVIESLTGKKDHFALRVDAMYLVNPDNRQQKFYQGLFPLVLDSGTAITRMPAEYMKPIYEALHVRFDSNGVPYVRCSRLTRGGGIGIAVNGVELLFSFADIATPHDPGYKFCIPGIMTGPIPCLGANFLRSLYIVFDLEKPEIGIALANTALTVRTTPPEVFIMSNGIPGHLAPHYTPNNIALGNTIYPVQFGRGLRAEPVNGLPPVILGDVNKQCLSWHCIMMEARNPVH